MVILEPLAAHDLRAFGADFLRQYHYLGKLPDPRTSLEGYAVHLGPNGYARWGLMTFGRPQAQRCRDWYGSVDDVQAGRCECTRWQVLNLSRLVIHPDMQRGGRFYGEGVQPGYTDRFGVWQSTLASTAIKVAAERVGFDYLIRRPPVYLDEPYQIMWLMSYCDTRRHRGTIYKASGFELYSTNTDGIQTWRMRLPLLTTEQHAAVFLASMRDPRANKFRRERAQFSMQLEV